MDFLNKAFAQVAELFRSMSPAARVTTGLLLVLVVVSGGYLFNHRISGGDSYLLEGQHFSQPELQAMQSAFGQAGLSGYEIDGGRIRVPSGLKAKYMAALADADAMPAHFGSHLDAAVNKPSPFTSKAQQEAMLKNAKQKELAAIIRWMNGIESAAVLYDAQKKPGLGGEQLVTASVTVKPVGSKPLEPVQVRKIRDLVTTAIVGLDITNVTVVDVNGTSYRGGAGGNAQDVFDDPYAQRVKYWQEYYQSTILDALKYVPGAVVTANVELDPRSKLQEEKTHVDPKVVALDVLDETENNKSESAGPSGQPGLQAQRPNAPATLPAQARGTQTDKERTVRREKNDTSRDWTKTETVGLTPKRVKVTVGVPTSYFEKLYRDQNPSPSGQPPPDIDKKMLAQIQTDEISKIQSHITNLIPQSDLTADPRPLVTVTPFHPLPVGEIPEPATSDIALGWLAANWSTAAMACLGLVSLVMLRSMARAVPVQTATPDLPLPAAPPPSDKEEKEQETAEDEVKATNRLKRRIGSGQSLRDELAEMVREDPDTAASILRSWIGNAS
jgi:flagellar M-ring protein FliF